MCSDTAEIINQVGKTLLTSHPYYGMYNKLCARRALMFDHMSKLSKEQKRSDKALKQLHNEVNDYSVKLAAMPPHPSLNIPFADQLDYYAERDLLVTQHKSAHNLNLEKSSELTKHASQISKSLLRVKNHLHTVRVQISLLDINNSIDNVHPHASKLNKYFKLFTVEALNERHSIPKKPQSYLDDAARQLIQIQAKTRRGHMMQRVMNGLQTAHSKGWFIIFETLSLDNGMIKQFYDDPHAIRDYMRAIGRKVLLAEGRSTKLSTKDCFQYFLVPEYGGKHGRLHFHALIMLRTLPLGSRDPNFGRPNHRRNNRCLGSLHNNWKYGFNLPCMTRYEGDAFTRAGYLMHVDQDGKVPELKPLIAIGHYVAKYVNKNVELSQLRNIKEDVKWNRTLMTVLKSIPTHSFKVRMTRGFGMELPPMNALTPRALLELTQMSYKSVNFTMILRSNALKTLNKLLRKITINDIQATLLSKPNLLEALRNSTQTKQTFNEQNFMITSTPKLKDSDISNDTYKYLKEAGLFKPTDVRNKRSRLGAK